MLLLYGATSLYAGIIELDVTSAVYNLKSYICPTNGTLPFLWQGATDGRLSTSAIRRRGILHFEINCQWDNSKILFCSQILPCSEGQAMIQWCLAIHRPHQLSACLEDRSFGKLLWVWSALQDRLCQQSCPLLWLPYLAFARCRPATWGLVNINVSKKSYSKAALD